MIIAGQHSFENFEQSQGPFKRYQATASRATPGFPELVFRGAKIVWDEYVKASCTTQSEAATDHDLMYFLNTKYLEFVVDSQTDMIMGEWMTPEEQDAKTRHILWMGNILESKRAKHGLLSENASATDIT